MLKKYETHQKNIKPTQVLPVGSGVACTETKCDGEMMVHKPAKKHPQLPELYRASCGICGWRGWVGYQPEEVHPTDGDVRMTEYRDKIRELSEKKELVDLGVINDSELESLRSEIKVIGIELGRI